MTTTTSESDQRDTSTINLQPFITRGVRRTVLANGLTVLTREVHDRPVVASMIWYRVGSRNEEFGQTGKSHFLEHMLFKGTSQFKKGDIDLITLRNGGANNAFTWLDFTAYYFTYASDRWEVALDIEASRMRGTLFDREEFESEKQVVQEELRIGLDGPWEALENEVWAAAFRQHPYHWPTVGWLQDLEAASAEDMKAYYDRWYHPRNATIVLVGDLNTEESLRRIEELFGNIPPGPEPLTPRVIEPPQAGEKRVVVRKDSPVERLLIGYHAPPVGHPDSYTMQVLETILSHGKTSRLYQRLIDKDQSVTTVRASFHDHIDPSLFYIQAEVKPDFTLAGVETAIYEEIDRIKSEPVSRAEIEKAKTQIEAELVIGAECPLQQAILLGQFETIAIGEDIPEESRGYRYLDTLMKRIVEVEPEHVGEAAGKYLHVDNRTVGHLVRQHVPAAGNGDIESSKPANRFDPRARSSFRSGFRTETGEPPAIRPTRPSLMVERAVLDNGLTLLVSENHSIPSISMLAVVNAGSRYETDEQAGLASLVGSLIDEGTQSRTSLQIAEAVENVGGRFTTFGEYQSSGVRASFLSRDLPTGIEIIADILTSAVFPDARVGQYVERRVAQIKSRLDIPRVKALDEFNELVFSGHPQHRPAVGYEQTVRTLTRDSVLAFYRRFYAPNNSYLVVVGDIDAAEVRDRVEQRFGSWPSIKHFSLDPVPDPTLQSSPLQKFVFAPKEQINIFMGHLGVRRTDPDFYTLLVMDTILGSSPGFTSRIPRILRDEQGLAYTTFSNITSSAGLDPGRFVAYIGTSPKNLEQATSGIQKEIERIVAEPVSEQELESAKAYLTGHFVFDFQSNAQIADFLLEAERYQLGFDYIDRYPAIINAVTVDDVSRVTRAHIHPGLMTTVVVGPIDDRGRPVEDRDHASAAGA